MPVETRAVTGRQIYAAYREANGGAPWGALLPIEREVWNATATNLDFALERSAAERDEFRERAIVAEQEVGRLRREVEALRDGEHLVGFVSAGWVADRLDAALAGGES